MRIQISAGGIFGANGEEIPLGTEFEVEKEPVGWAGRYTVIAESKGKKAVTAEKPQEDPELAALEALKVDELKALADHEKIDLGTASAKGDMITAILKARADRKA